MVFQNDILAGASGAAAGYTIDQSIRFNDNDSAYLSRTFGTPTDATNWTFSTWIKRCNLGTEQWFFNSGASAAAYYIRFESTDKIRFRASTSWDITTTQVFRDVSAWYHIVATFENGAVTLYVNNESIATASVSDATYNFFTNIIHSIGGSTIGNNTSDLYLAETHGIDGQALAPTDFGETNDDGVWIPKAYSGSYGNNGFYITGADSADLGADESGNSNDFTSSGLTSDDQVSDSPTDNYAVFNNIIKGENSYHAGSYGWGSNTISEGGLKVLGPTGTNLAGATISYPSSGKFYYEATYIGTDTAFFGIADLYDDTKAVWYRNNGWVSENSSSWNTSSGAASYSAGDVLAIAVNMDDNEAKFYKNNSLQSTVSLTAGSTYTPVLFGGNSSIGFSIDFGQLGFTYTPPTGFSALSTANLPTQTIADGSAYFQTTLYSGNGSTQEINQSGNSTFQPSWVWIKERNGTRVHSVYDEVRGVEKYLQTNETDAESTSSLSLTSFDSDGFTLGSGAWVNNSGNTYVGWQWLAANGTASNTDGSITSTVSANTTAGFSIVSYTGNGTAGATVGHGLGVAPDLLIVKNRDNTEQWIVYHQYNGGTKYLLLNSNAAVATSSGAWDNTDPSSSVVTLGGGGFGTNVSSNAMIMYAFAEVEGFSKFGSYTGNGSTDGSYVWCGFRPAFVIIKCSSVANSWTMYDTTRQTYNPNGRYILAESSAAEVASTTVEIDILSNGFKARDNQNNINGSGRSYIFMAFAEHPFGGNGVAPVPAR
jgi:hypothetical protein